MSTIRANSIQNLAGTATANLNLATGFGKGALQSVQILDSSVVSYSGSSWYALPLTTSFTPLSATSKIIISTNFVMTNIQTNDWTLYTMRFRVGDEYPYSRYIGCHYHQSYVPVEITYQHNSWGTTAKTIEVQVSFHASYQHQYNRKVWDPGAGAVNNTSILRIMEVEI